MDKNAKIYVAGHHGLVGSAIWKNLQEKEYTNLVGRTHKELDLLDGAAVKQFFDEEMPEYVFLAAAFVGGIMANSIYRADFIYKNLQIQQNVIGESFRHQVKCKPVRVFCHLFSVCLIFPIPCFIIFLKYFLIFFQGMPPAIASCIICSLTFWLPLLPRYSRLHFHWKVG